MLEYNNRKTREGGLKMGSDFLFATPSFSMGLAAVLDVGGNLIEYNNSRTPAEADRRAIRSDWETIGNDIRTAMRVVDGAKSK